MGAWIEISSSILICLSWQASLPTWERGLKYMPSIADAVQVWVAPYMGAWIEINYVCGFLLIRWSRSLHGSVD